jgi:hypothetical protein
MNHYVNLALTNRKSSIHLHAFYSPRTALRMFTPRRDHLMVCLLYILCRGYPQSSWLRPNLSKRSQNHPASCFLVFALYTSSFFGALPPCAHRCSSEELCNKLLTLTSVVRMMCHNPIKHNQLHLSYIYVNRPTTRMPMRKLSRYSMQAPWGEGYSFYSFLTSALDGVSGQLHATAALYPGKGPPLRIG